MPAPRRLTSLLIAFGLCVGALTVHTAAHAAAETCQGRTATVVGSPGRMELRGTEGPDVIVTHGSASILALGGDDVICLTSPPGKKSSLRVYAGDGDDLVVNLRDGRASKALTELGAGEDVYRGSRGKDVVVEPYDQTVDDGVEGIRTGARRGSCGDRRLRAAELRRRRPRRRSRPADRELDRQRQRRPRRSRRCRQAQWTGSVRREGGDRQPGGERNTRRGRDVRLGRLRGVQPRRLQVAPRRASWAVGRTRE